MSETITPQNTVDNVLSYLDRVRDAVAQQAPGVAASYDTLKKNLSEAPDGGLSASSMKRLAFTVQDFERAVGPVLPQAHPMTTRLREEATTLPGEVDPTVTALMAQTATAKDQTVVDRIRDVARTVVTEKMSTAHPSLAYEVDEIQKALHAAPSSGASRPEPSTGRAHASPGGGDQAAQQGSGTQNTSASPEGSADPAGTRQQPDPKSDTTSGNPEQTETRTPQRMSVASAAVNGFSRLANAIATQIEARPPTTDDSWLNRASAYSQRQSEARADRDMDRTAQLGSEAVDALRAMKQGSGAGIMTEISNAASGNPDGVAGVLSGMKPGGRYADLYSRFETEKVNNQEFAAQIEDAGAKLGAYSKGREAADALGAKLGTADRITQRFTQIDAQVAAEAGTVPGKTPGTSMVEDMSEKAKELVKKALDAISRIFRPGPSAGASMSP